MNRRSLNKHLSYKGALAYSVGTSVGWGSLVVTCNTYLAILWANATSLPLFARIFMDGTFRKGRLYSLFGYDVYIGEVILSSCALIIIGCLCMNYKKVMNACMIILAAVFTVGIAICFLASMFGRSGSISPLFVNDTSALSQIIGIAVISPWAFIGFESISHASEECTFDSVKIGKSPYCLGCPDDSYLYNDNGPFRYSIS